MIFKLPNWRALFAAPTVRCLVALAMISYDLVLHLIFTIWGVDYWVNTAHIIFWPRFYDNATYNAFWAGWYLIVVVLIVSCMVRWRQDIARTAPD